MGYDIDSPNVRNWPPILEPPPDGWPRSISLKSVDLPEGFVWELDSNIRSLEIDNLKMSQGSMILVGKDCQRFSLSVENGVFENWTTILHVARAGGRRKKQGLPGLPGADLFVAIRNAEFQLYNASWKDPSDELKQAIREGGRRLDFASRYSMSGVSVISAGGNGGNGKKGKAGDNARRKSCSSWEGGGAPATRGADGGLGGDGGRGGLITGNVTLQGPVDSETPIFFAAFGGDGGDGGIGGAGGQGVGPRQCIGYSRGGFPAASPGDNGDDGEDADAPDPYVIFQ